MLSRQELYHTQEYWIERIQNDIFRAMLQFKEDEELNQTQLAQRLGVSKGYISQVLNGNFNFSISKLVELALAIGVAPKVELEKLATFINREEWRLKAINEGRNIGLNDDATFATYAGFFLKPEADNNPFEKVA